MKVLRWLMVVPGAVLALMLGSLAGGVALSIFNNQNLTDAGSAFLGSFALVFATGLIAPSKRINTTFVFAGIIACLAALSFVVSVVFNLEPLSSRTTLAKVIIPVAQILGALYGSFLLQPMVVPNAKLEDLWREIRALGCIVFFFGILVSLVGLTVGLLGYSWVGLITGMGVITLGISTWIFPFIHLFVRVARFEAKFERSFSEENNTTDDGHLSRKGGLDKKVGK